MADLLRALAEFRFHANDQVKQLFTLDHLRGGLAAHARLHDGLHIGDVDPVAGDLFAIDIDQQAGLAQFTDHGQFGEARDALQRVFNFDGGILQNVQIRAIDLHRQRAFESGERLIHGVLGRLREVEDDAGIGVQPLCESNRSSASLV